MTHPISGVSAPAGAFPKVLTSIASLALAIFVAFASPVTAQTKEELIKELTSVGTITVNTSNHLNQSFAFPIKFEMKDGAVVGSIGDPTGKFWTEGVATLIKPSNDIEFQIQYMNTRFPCPQGRTYCHWVTGKERAGPGKFTGTFSWVYPGGTTTKAATMAPVFKP